MKFTAPLHPPPRRSLEIWKWLYSHISPEKIYYTFFGIAVFPYSWWKAEPISFLSLSYPWFEKGTHLLPGWQFSRCLKKQICIIMSTFFKRSSLRSAWISFRDSWRTLWLESHLDRSLISIFNLIIQAIRSNCVQSWNTYAMASQPAYDGVTSSYWHRCDVMTSHRRQYNVKCLLGCYTTEPNLGAVPAGTWLRKDDGLTLIRRGDVLSTSIRRRC